MKILITGATGFIGKNLIDHLSTETGFELIAVTRNPNVEKANTKTRFIQVSLSQPGYVSQLPVDIDTIIYLAQSAEYRHFPSGASDMFRINVAAVAELLDWAQKNKIRKFIFASTGNVYKPQDKLLIESDPTAGTSFYAVTKLSAENLVQCYSQFFQTVIIRIFSVYGPNQQDMMIPNMISKIKSGELITLAQNKGIKLTPVFISDAVEMIKRAVTTEIESGIYNLSGNEMIDLAHIVTMLGNHLKIKPVIKTTADQAGSLRGDATKLYNAIDYTPLTNMTKGIALL